MAIAAIVMAGGKATRMQATTEKPLLQVRDKPMIQRVIEALRQSETVDRIIVAVTAGTQQTADTSRRLGVEVIETAGEGYESDMKQAIKTLGLKDVIVVSADLPFLVPRIIDDAVKSYSSSGKPALMVAAPIELYKKFGMEASYTFDLNGEQLAPVGLNVINGRRVHEPTLDETILVVRLDDLVFNVNTPTELESARNHPEHQNRTLKTKSARSPRPSYQLTRISALSALSVVGSFIHLPGPVQTIAFDSAPGFFAALLYGPLDGAAVCGLGHLATSIVNGFPLGLLHIPIAFGLALAGAAMGSFNRRFGLAPGVAIGIIINIILIMIAVPALGWQATLSFLPFLTLAAIANALVAIVAYRSLRGRVPS